MTHYFHSINFFYFFNILGARIRDYLNHYGVLVDSINKIYFDTRWDSNLLTYMWEYNLILSKIKTNNSNPKKWNTFSTLKNQKISLDIFFSGRKWSWKWQQLQTSNKKRGPSNSLQILDKNIAGDICTNNFCQFVD